MRTRTSRSHTETDSQKTGESVEIMTIRKSLHPLQEAAGDKENLVGAGRMPPSGKDETKTLKKIAAIPASSKSEKKKCATKTNKKVTAEDLTSQAGPSEHYWETLAERRRVALEKALKENLELHERIAALEEENRQCQTLLEESKALIDTLTDILNTNDSDQSANETSFISDTNEDDIDRPRDE